MSRHRPPDPMHNAKTFKGQFRQCALWDLVPDPKGHIGTKCFRLNQYDQVEMEDSPTLSSTNSTVI